MENVKLTLQAVLGKFIWRSSNSDISHKPIYYLQNYVSSYIERPFHMTPWTSVVYSIRAAAEE